MALPLAEASAFAREHALRPDASARVPVWKQRTIMKQWLRTIAWDSGKKHEKVQMRHSVFFIFLLPGAVFEGFGYNCLK